mgnify:FL=1
MAKKTTGQSASVVESVATAAAGKGASWQKKIWLKSYPAGVPHEIDLSKTSSIGDMILASCRQFPGNPAFTCMGKDLSFKELDEHSRALAAFLQSRGLV